MTKWLEFVKEYRSRNPEMSYKEALHYGAKEYKSQKTGGGIGKMMKKGKNMASQAKSAHDSAQKANAVAQKLYANNQNLISNVVGEENGAKLNKGMKKANKTAKTSQTVSNVATSVTGGSMNREKVTNGAIKTLELVKKGRRVYKKNKNVIDKAVDLGRSVSFINSPKPKPAQDGGKFKLKNLKKIANTISTIGAPIAMLSGHPEAGMALSGVSMATADNQGGGSVKIGGYRGNPTVGGSFRSNRTMRGGNVSNSYVGKPTLQNASPFIRIMQRPKPPGLRNRSMSVL